MARLLGSLVALLAVLLAGAAPPSVSAATVTVHLTDRVEPAELTIPPGTTVVFRNDSGNRHRMRSVEHAGDAGFDTGNLDPGQSAAVTFPADGVWPFVDDRERDDAAFQGTITVTSDPGASGGSGGAAGAGGRGSDGTAAAAPATAAVTIGDGVYSPRSVAVTAGGTVTWRNADGDEHTASARDGSWDSGIRPTGGTWSRRFATAGTFAYLCLLHPDMTGTVVVRAAGAPSGSAASTPAAPAPTPAAPAPTAAPIAPPAAAGATEVRLLAAAFEPVVTRIVTGATVHWVNPGPAMHTVSADDGAFESGLLQAGERFSATFDAPGRYGYVCTVHPGMAGTIVVGASTKADGTPPTPTSAAPVVGVVSPASPAVPAPASAPDPGAGPRIALVVLLVGAASVVFGGLIRSSVRPA